MKLFKSETAFNAFRMGFVCSFSYMIVYISRNTLSAVETEVIEGNIFTETSIGTLSALFLMCYAIGQLINGIIGEKIRANYMICVGLLAAGIGNVIFPFTINPFVLNCVIYSICGFSLSMIYAPMTKLVSENTTSKFASTICLTFTFASLFGAPLAGVIALIFGWKYSFVIAGVLLITMAIVCYVVFWFLENKGIIKYNQFKNASKEKGSIKILIENRIIRFTIVAILTGVVRTSVVFWIPTYAMDYLGFTKSQSTLIFTIITTIISVAPFSAAFIYKILKNSIYKTLFVSFTVSATAFLAMFVVKTPYVNLVLLVIALLASKIADAMLWSFYCPFLKETGMVSTATGFLDFASYSAAAFSNAVSPYATAAIGWGNLILVWCALMVAGVFCSFKNFPKRSNV